MITVQIEEDELYNMLIDRVEHWTDDRDTIELFEQYYDNMVYGGCFDGATINIMAIVDNDYVNNTSIVTCEEYTKDRNKYLRDEIREFIKDNKDTYEDDEEFKKALKDKIDELKELKEEAPEFDDIETGENNVSFLDGSYIEAKTNNSLLISY